MTPQAVAKWLTEHSTIPQKAIKPLATRLGVSTNYVGAALFAGQIIYENQDTIVEYTSKGGVTVGEFLHATAREQYGDDHPLTRYLGENVEALNEAFEGTEEEARTFAEFYRQYRKVDREHRLRDEVNLGVPAALAEKLPGRDAIPGRDAVPSLRGTNGDSDEAVDIPVTDAK